MVRLAIMYITFPHPPPCQLENTPHNLLGFDNLVFECHKVLHFYQLLWGDLHPSPLQKGGINWNKRCLQGEFSYLFLV